MSGHSHWSSIKHKKAAQDAKRGKIFSKLARVITIAAKQGGTDPDLNLRLRYAVDEARAANMPVVNIERAIKKSVSDTSADNYQEVVYEGYGSSGVAFLVLVLTENKNRTVPELRRIFEKNGGNLGQSGSVAWMFTATGFITVEKASIDEDAITEAALEAGADDITSTDEFWEVYCEPSDFEDVKASLISSGVQISSAEVTQLASTETTVSASAARKIINLMSALDDHEDVQKIYNNMSITDEIIAEMNKE